MSVIENIKVAAVGLKLNKMRSFLTMLGIIIGISSVISISTIGRSLSQSVAQGFDSFSSNSVSVYLDVKSGHEYSEITENDSMKGFQIESMKERFGDRIKAVALDGAGAGGKVRNGKERHSVNINSVSAGYMDANNIKMLSGRFLNDEDIDENREIVVISDKLVKKVYGGKPEKALGQELEVNIDAGGIRTYTIVGIYKHELQSFGILGGESADTPVPVYIPISVGNRQFAGIGADEFSIYNFIITTSSRDDLKSTAKEAEDFFNENYYKENESAVIRTETLESAISQINQVMSSVKLAIGAIAAISLLVGGIGVMNILLVSVTERTREIGIRKALGATNRDIRSQFIIESIIICVIGGAIGVLFGSVLGYLGSILIKAPTLPAISSVIIAVGFSMFIGVFFGYYPSNKAAKLDPIDALRYE